MKAHRLYDGTAVGTVEPDHIYKFSAITPQGVLPPSLRDQCRTGLIWVLKRDQMRPVAVTAICCGNDTCRIFYSFKYQPFYISIQQNLIRIHLIVDGADLLDIMRFQGLLHQLGG